MIEAAHTIDERNIPRRIEFDINDIPLGGRDDNALDPFLMLEIARVAADNFHPGAGKGEVEGSGVRDVGEQEPNDLAASRGQAPARLSIDEKYVAKATHERV